MQTALVCLCLLSTAFAIPVPPPLPGTAAGNCVGQHRILLKGCNAKHGFYVFKYIFFSTRKNQTQIKKEEASSQDTLPSHRLGEDDARQGPTENGAVLERDDNGSTEVMENSTSLKPQNHSTPGTGGDAHSPHPGTITQAHSGVGITGPMPASSEGSGDQSVVVEDDGVISTLPQGSHLGKVVVGNRSSSRSEDRDDSATREAATTAGKERAHTSGGAGDEGSGEATIRGHGQEDVVQGTKTGGPNFTSVTEKLETVQVDDEGVGEYTYIPSSGSVTVTSGQGARTSFTQLPDKDDEVTIFIGKANIHVGEQEATQPGAAFGSKRDGTSSVGSSSPLPSLRVTATPDGEREGGIPARRRPERPATTATLSHGDSATSSPGHGRSTEDSKDAATTAGDRRETVVPTTGDNEDAATTAGDRQETVVPTTGDNEDAATTAGDRRGPVVPATEDNEDAATTAGDRRKTVVPATEDNEDAATTAGDRRKTVVPTTGDNEDAATTAGDRRKTVVPATEDNEDAATTAGDRRKTVVPTTEDNEDAATTAGDRRKTVVPTTGDNEDAATTAGDRRETVVPATEGNEDAATTAGDRRGPVVPTTGDNEDAATTVGDRRGPVVPTTGDNEDAATTAGDRRGPVVPTTEGNEDAATTAGARQEPVVPTPWGVAGEDVTVPMGSDRHGNGDDKVGGEGHGFKGKLGGLAVTMPHRGGDDATIATVTPKGASIHLSTTPASPRTSKEVRTTALGTVGGTGGTTAPAMPRSTAAGRRGSGEVRLATTKPPREGWPGAGVKGQVPGLGLGTSSRTKQEPSPHGQAGSWAPSRAPGRAGGRGGGAEGGQGATQVGGSSLPLAGQAGGSTAEGKAQERGQGGEPKGAPAGAGGGRLPGRYDRRPWAGAPGTFSALSRSRQLDQLRRADELHVRERAFYSLGTGGAGPHGPHASLASADSSQSFEGEQGSRSDSQQAGLQPSAWGAPAHPYGRWIQGTL
ncbi:ovocleidin-116-like isoform X2 [Pogoniulus pusillus]|uniref:ovocleidin-116-like isoform X2 n=1 Tax=Pogoniulus pusillus TaxID=488313 RepID=UPI0030B91E83